VFASGLDARPAIEKFFIGPDGRPTVDAIVNLTGFSLVGGPAYSDAQAAREVLGKLDLPYLAAHAIEFQTIEDWMRGLDCCERIESLIHAERGKAVAEAANTLQGAAKTLAQRLGAANGSVVVGPQCNLDLAADETRQRSLQLLKRLNTKLPKVAFCLWHRGSGQPAIRPKQTPGMLRWFQDLEGNFVTGCP
jgi:hypothetical protein